MVSPPNLFLKFNLSQLPLKISGTGLRAAIAGAATGAFYVAANFMLPDYFAFSKFDPAYITGSDKAAYSVLLFCPAIAGAAGFVLPPHVKNVIQIFSKLKPSRGAASAPSPAQPEAAAPPAAAGQVEAAAAPAPTLLAQEQAGTQLAAPPPPQQASSSSMEDMVTMIEDMVGKKVGEVVTDVTNMKNEVTSFRDDISKLKEDIRNLTLSFESSLTDLKAFQAEMVNPLNFMRKYFETMDIKNLSDPIQGLPHVELPSKTQVQHQKKEGQAAAEQKPEVHDGDDNDDDKKIDTIPAESPLADDDDGDEDDAGRTSLGTPHAAVENAFQHLLPQAERLGGEMPVVSYKQQDSGSGNGNGNGNGNGHANPLFQGNLTLGKLMSMVSILDKMLRDMGPDELEALIEQYRQFGLKAEDEAAIYKVVGMLKDFGMSADEAMVRLYRLGQIMGIKDAQADLEYAKLKARAKPSKSASSAASRVGHSTWSYKGTG